MPMMIVAPVPIVAKTMIAMKSSGITEKRIAEKLTRSIVVPTIVRKNERL